MLVVEGAASVGSMRKEGMHYVGGGGGGVCHQDEEGRHALCWWWRGRRLSAG